ncbi:MAG TPA: transglycosylase domain-containing protein [Candidatus Dormibacteraeota bacterium]|nr:transglycosylase domain-containing protein [Candidatus Dormibacteraeota bacterium]
MTISLVVGAVWVNAQMSSLPAPNSSPPTDQSIVIYDRNGNILAERNAQGSFHVVVKLGEMGQLAPAAMLAAEDRDFYKHGALDPISIGRAIIVDGLNRQPIQGASTITQQLVKIETNNSEKTFTRKVREALTANQMEQKYSKDQILEAYLNRVYYGHRAYGIGAATKTYFGSSKQVKDLTPAQAAFLAGLVRAPSAEDPETNFDAAQSREMDVLKSMVQSGALTQDQADMAAKEDIKSELKFDTSYGQTKAPHFVDYVLATLENQFGADAVQHGGISVHTTLDPDMQAKAEQAVRDGVKAMSSKGVNNGMMMAVRADTGEVLAWVGSADYANQAIGGQFDVIRSPRQPGSSFKPYVYEAALKDRRITLGSCLADVPTDFNGYKPTDFDNAYMGDMPARQALVLSRNIPAVATAKNEGIANVINLAQSMGIRTQLQPNLATAIGGSEVTMFDHIQGYQVFANQGKKMPLISITKISDSAGNTLFEAVPGQQAGQAQVLSPEEAYLMTDTLKAYQDQWHLGWKVQMASKSGTTGAAQVGVHQDAWMMAYNHDVVVGGWAGNTAAGGGGKNISAFGVDTGSTMLAEFINGLPAAMNGWYQQPSGLVSRGGELYLPGTENQPGSCDSRGRSNDNNGDNGSPNFNGLPGGLFNGRRDGNGRGGGGGGGG